MESALTSRDNLNDFSITFDRYWRIFKGSMPEALAKVGRNFSIALYRELKDRAHHKGEISNLLHERLKSGKAVYISQRAREMASTRMGLSQQIGSRSMQINRGKSANVQQALMEQEIKLREGRRMFTAFAGKFSGSFEQPTFAKLKGDTLGKAEQHADQEMNELRFEWDSNVGKWSAVSATGLTNAKRIAAFGAALVNVRNDMIVYIKRQQAKAATAAIKNAGL